jgi:hypothetical protein
MDEKPKFDWQGFLFVLLVIPGFVLFVILLSPVIGTYFIYEKIKYRTKPPECCASGCSTCPWGDSKYKKYREAYKAWRSPERNSRPRVHIGNEELFGKRPLTKFSIKWQQPNQSPTSESD